jgi:D-amino-acid dehydrogenase
MAESVDVLIVGGGAIGLCSALSAAERGAQVLLVEANQIGHGSSYANAGLIVPSFSLPLANPEAIKELPSLLWGRDKSLHLKPRLDPAFFRWTLKFLAASRQKRMLKTAAQLSRLGQHSLEKIQGWDPDGKHFDFQRHGWLHLYESEKGFQQGIDEAELLREIGMAVDELTPAEIRELEPALENKINGGLHYSQEAQLEPYEFCDWVARRAEESGVSIRQDTPVIRLSGSNGHIRGAELQGETIRAGEYLIAAGAWTSQLVAPLIGWLPMEPAKGYSVTYKSPARKPNRPLMWAEKHVVMTPFKDQLRLTTGLDLVGFDDSLSADMIAKLRRTAGHWTRDAGGGEQEPEAWYGYRPLTPDGLPIIGRTAQYNNLHLATGHGQLGITLAPVTGDLVAAELAGSKPPLDPASLSPARFNL